MDIPEKLKRVQQANLQIKVQVGPNKAAVEAPMMGGLIDRMKSTWAVTSDGVLSSDVMEY